MDALVRRLAPVAVQGRMPGMKKKHGHGSPGGRRNRSNVTFWVFIALAVVVGVLMYRAATNRGPADTGYRSLYTAEHATPAPTSTGVPPARPRRGRP